VNPEEIPMNAPSTPDPLQNRILAALPAAERARLEDDLELVTLPIGHVLFEPGDILDFVYFPTTCIVSLVFTTEDGSSAELAMTGSDGLIGIPLVLGGRTTTYKAVVQSEGAAFRLRAAVMGWELDQHGNLLRLCLCFTQALLTQMAQSVVCNRHHSVDQQLCRWILLSLDRLPGNQLDMTQELIANMLGVRREAVTEAAGKLQAAGLIHYRRGHITVTDRPGLEARVCECYRVVRAEYDRLFHLPPVTLPTDRARPNPATLRRRAEARVQQAPPPHPGAQWEAERLVHELQVHQIELELTNEELRHAYDEADALRQKYADIYDFAPLAYFTLDAQGVIVQLNLAGAILLGLQRSNTRPYRFAAFVEPEFLPVFNRFHEEVLQGKCTRKCELGLSATDRRPRTRVSIQAVADESGRECRMVVIDIGAEKPEKRGLQSPRQQAAHDNQVFSAHAGKDPQEAIAPPVGNRRE
jgi:CRP-like cAMP-binding protein